ncbi:hypothetical protein C2G38_2065189 [Gigaspora rosea]|uniref:Uncharacterized protein n=1 Tax=Gigaspora rosea TaxID=44941 RepID=A0A397W4M1_9GLOM|nr:hypothetical protein C2G38_2069702 [Gigaspora rosea]RIB26336.1 hypothetical protein C2G38_2065189 [Gigaspora rosea]
MLCVISWDSKSNKPSFQVLEMKDLVACTGKSIAQTLQDTFNHFKLNPQQCFVCVTDNTNYMSGKTGGAISLFNKLNNTNMFRIPCGLHVAHIIMNNFEEAAFGKLPSVSGFSQKEHPANLLYLAWELHDGYSKSDKDKPMGIRWLYELKCAEQFLERKDIHIKFTEWFLSRLKNRNNTPKSYITKMGLFYNWLQNLILNIQIRLLVRFGRDLYYPMTRFLMGYDSELNENLSINLSPGYRAHQMSDFVARITTKLSNIVENPYSFFRDELLESLNLLNDDQLAKLISDLECGAKKALELHQKWLNCWLHLPQSVCRLGGKYGWEFARSYAHVVLKIPLLSVPSLRELCYMKFIKLDTEAGEFNDFGLLAALQDPGFNHEFNQFIQERKPLSEFPKIFEFVKHRIWYIMIHQQEVEGLFNKWDLKTHPNMSSDLQQSKMRLASLPLNEIGCNSSDLLEFRTRKRQQQARFMNNQISSKENLNDSDRKEKANKLFDDLFERK